MTVHIVCRYGAYRRTTKQRASATPSPSTTKANAYLALLAYMRAQETRIKR